MFAWNIWVQILLTNEVANVAVTRSQGHLRTGLEPAALASKNSLSVWNEKKLLHVPIGGHPLTPPLINHGLPYLTQRRVWDRHYPKKKKKASGGARTRGPAIT